MPEYVGHKVAEALNDSAKALKGSKVLLLGLAYKANVDDDRESPSYTLLDMLSHRGAQVSYYDPFVPVIRLTREQRDDEVEAASNELSTAAKVSVTEQSLLENRWPFMREGLIVGANSSPGARDVWMGRPHRLANSLDTVA
jgi:UDP-N-acetyl-D-glucosamine dehydrogenase